MNKVSKGKFNEHIAEMLGDKLQLPLDKMKFEIAFKYEPDAVNQQAREVFYCKRREMLLKLATPKNKARMDLNAL